MFGCPHMRIGFKKLCLRSPAGWDGSLIAAFWISFHFFSVTLRVSRYLSNPQKSLLRLCNRHGPKEAYSEVFPEDFSSPKRQFSYVFTRMPNLRQTGPPSTPLSTSQYSAVTSLSACNAFNPPWSITYRENLHLFLALTQFFPPRSNKPFTHVSRQWKSWHAFCLNMTAKTFSLLGKFKICACKKKDDKIKLYAFKYICRL